MVREKLQKVREKSGKSQGISFSRSCGNPAMAFQWNSMASRWNAVEYHVIPWDTEDCHSLYGFYAISMAFQWNYMASRWNVVECHGIPWDTEDRLILTVEIHE